jgi:hypothetical protein
VSQRPLAIVSGLTIGDYLLWNWSLNHSHDVLALISGLTLPPLVLVCAWLLVVSAARLLAHATRRQAAGSGTARSRPAQRAPGSPTSQSPASTATTGSSRKLAA